MEIRKSGASGHPGHGLLLRLVVREPSGPWGWRHGRTCQTEVRSLRIPSRPTLEVDDQITRYSREKPAQGVRGSRTSRGFRRPTSVPSVWGASHRVTTLRPAVDVARGWRRRTRG